MDGQCNETLKVTAEIEPQYVTSPGYDDDRLYSGDLTCRWQIKAAPGTNLVFSLTISHIPCFLGDYVKIFLDNETQVLNNGDFCGKAKSFGPMSFENSSVLVVVFVSRSSNVMTMSKQGFRLQYLSAIDLSGNGCQGKQVLMSDDTSQYISSPNFPYRYPPNAECEWEIRAPVGYDVNVLIVFIDIENDMLCSFDSIKFQEGSTLNINSLCTENNFSFGNVRGSSFTVSFSSDDSENRHGFLLRYRSTEAISKDCSESKADIVFLLDSSGSVGETNFAFLTSFIGDLISDFNIGPEFIQVGLVTYETSVSNHFDLNQYATKEALINATDNVSYKGGWTYTDKGLNYTLRHSFTEEHGARSDTTRVLLVFTDGVSNHPLSTRAMALEVKNAGIIVIPVGVGSGVDSPELFFISSREEYVFRATSFTDLDPIKNSLENIICKIISSLSQHFFQTTEILPIFAPPLLESNTSPSYSGVTANQEPSTTESLSSTPATSEATSSEYSASSITSSNQMSTIGASSTTSSNQMSTTRASSSLSTNQTSTTGNSTTKEEITDGFTSSVYLTPTGTMPDDPSVISTTTLKSTQRTSCPKQSTKGSATDLFGDFVLTRDTIAIISVCTVFVFLSLISCCLLICLCIARQRAKKRAAKRRKLHGDLEKNDRKHLPSVYNN
ncbi:cartilage matrix protein-like [Saccostrea echinata]|uniref:cartilage matrix protein-like n=1 Tax=Saccostrea echinata TaxID=191078 RepID=UPI002A7F6763|nr:cartilage matrix protein-like [Saccostrea echinata]